MRTKAGGVRLIVDSTASMVLTFCEPDLVSSGDVTRESMSSESRRERRPDALSPQPTNAMHRDDCSTEH